MAYRKAWGQPQNGRGEARNLKSIGGTISMATTDLAANATVGAFVVPTGFTPLQIAVVASDMDSGGSPALAFKIGDAGDDDRLLASSTIGQAGGTATTLATAGYRYTYTADTEVLITIGTASATAVAGTIDISLVGYIV